jgi:hypothetical protein
MKRGPLHSKLQSALTPEDYRKIKPALESGNEEKLSEMNSQFNFSEIISDHNELTSRIDLFQLLQEKAYRDIYGAAISEVELEQRIDTQRKIGLVESYIDIFDRCGIAMALTNIHKFNSNQWPKERFRWLPHLDTFIFPFGGDHFLRRGGSSEDYGSYIFTHPDREMIQHLRQSGLDQIPQDFSDYLIWVHEIMNRLKNSGVAAMKLLMAYFRTLETDDVEILEAERSFDRGLQGDIEATRAFEDFMVRELIRYCGVLDLPVQIHVGRGGPGPGALLTESQPEFLHPIFEHPELRKTKIIVLHGCSPYTQACGALASQHINVYIDISALTMCSYHFLVNQLVYWLEEMPASKLLFGSDAWTPEMFWVAVKNMKKALGNSLEKMIDAGFYDASEATKIAKAIFYGNASKVYNLHIQD